MWRQNLYNTNTARYKKNIKPIIFMRKQRGKF